MEVDPSPGSPAPAPVFSPLAPNHLLTSLTTPTLEQVESHFKPSFSAPIEWLNSVIAQAQAGAKDQDQDEEVASLTELKTLYERNLWHNLTIKVEKYVDGHVAPAGQSNGRAGVDQVEMFKSFIRPIHSKLNPLKYVELAKKVVRSCQGESAILSSAQMASVRLCGLSRATFMPTIVRQLRQTHLLIAPNIFKRSFCINVPHVSLPPSLLDLNIPPPDPSNFLVPSGLFTARPIHHPRASLVRLHPAPRSHGLPNHDQPSYPKGIYSSSSNLTRNSGVCTLSFKSRLCVSAERRAGEE